MKYTIANYNRRIILTLLIGIATCALLLSLPNLFVNTIYAQSSCSSEDDIENGICADIKEVDYNACPRNCDYEGSDGTQINPIDVQLGDHICNGDECGVVSNIYFPISGGRYGALALYNGENRSFLAEGEINPVFRYTGPPQEAVIPEFTAGDRICNAQGQCGVFENISATTETGEQNYTIRQDDGNIMSIPINGARLADTTSGQAGVPFKAGVRICNAQGQCGVVENISTTTETGEQNYTIRQDNGNIMSIPINGARLDNTQSGQAQPADFRKGTWYCDATNNCGYYISDFNHNGSTLHKLCASPDGSGACYGVPAATPKQKNTNPNQTVGHLGQPLNGCVVGEKCTHNGVTGNLYYDWQTGQYRILDPISGRSTVVPPSTGGAQQPANGGYPGTGGTGVGAGNPSGGASNPATGSGENTLGGPSGTPISPKDYDPIKYDFADPPPGVGCFKGVCWNT